jgi:hypothetical protein
LRLEQFRVPRVAAALEGEAGLEERQRGDQFLVVRAGQEALEGVGGFEVIAALQVERAQEDGGFRAGLGVEVLLRHLGDGREVVVGLDRLVEHR